MLSTLRSLGLAALVGSTIGLAAVSVPAPFAAAAEFPPRNPEEWSFASRTVTIDGRDVRVSVSAFLVSITTSTGSTANTTVTLEALDGDAIPEGLIAEHIRMQRVNLPARVIHRDLINIDPESLQPGPFANFGLERGFETAPRGAKFRTTVRLNFDGRDMLVPMGTIRVNTNTLVVTDPVLTTPLDPRTE